jgi:hypothetical protein
VIILWQWLTQTNSGLATRIAAGVIIFAILALIDFRRNGNQATRWREYAFLLLCVVAALAYGIVNDLITSTISWEYFSYGKGLWPDVLPDVPPDSLRLHLAACVVGMKATWTVGLMIGVALLLANNPRKDRPQLPLSALAKRLVWILIVTIIIALAFGIAGDKGIFAHFSDDFAQMLRRNEMRPRRFMTVFGIHLGGYVGGLIGLCGAVISVACRRKQPAPSLA